MTAASDEFDLFQVDILIKLAQDREFFQSCIAANYFSRAEQFWCDVQVSKHKLREAWEFWVRDTDRLLERDVDTKTNELDEFKQSAFLTFWLRRHQPLKTIRRLEVQDTGLAVGYRLLQKFYSRYGNDFGAVDIGANICLNYCASSIDSLIEGNDTDPRRASLQSRENYLKIFERRKDFWADFSMILKHKNNSPHSITLIYEALFGFSLPPVRKRELRSGRM